MNTSTINPNCDVCHGTGVDEAFGGSCSMCWWDVSSHSDQGDDGFGMQMRSRFSDNGNQHSRANNMQGAERPSDKQIALILKLDPQAEIPSNRKMASVLIDKLLGKSEAPNPGTETIKPTTAIKWAKVGDKWLVRIPTSVIVHSGDTVTVTKANGESKEVVLGTRYIGQDDLWNEAPRAPAARPSVPDVPEGRYAIESKGHNDLLFVQVQRPTEGKWAGYVFVKMIVGGHEPSAIKGAQMHDVLARIAEAGIVESMSLYGQELGQCGHCGRALTDDARERYETWIASTRIRKMSSPRQQPSREYFGAPRAADISTKRQ